MTKRDHTELLEKNLLAREEQLFITVTKEKYEWAVNDTSRRGVLGPGVGAAFVQRELLKTVRERMQVVAIELAEVDLATDKLTTILESIFDRYMLLTLGLLQKPAVWGSQSNEDTQKRLQR